MTDAGLISHIQAREAAARLIHSAFNPLDRTAKLSIPAQDSDDDIVLVAYIAQQENLEMLCKGRFIPAEASHS